MKKLNKKGFTIVELVIVIAVIAILAAVLIPTFATVITKANESAVLQAGRNAYTEYLAEDISDGVLDNKVNGTDITMTGVVATVNSTTKADYSSFVYTDTTRGLKATYNGSSWDVSTAS